jgi:catechol 2,3-dioxygenase-like lactoylglutathione lyase family enzyme
MARIRWTPEQIEAYERDLAKRPHFSNLNHVSLIVDDLDVAKRFYVEVMGGRLINDGTPNFVEVVVAGMIIGLADVRGRPQEASSEFPHLAFEIESDQFMPMIAWLERQGVATHPAWTRHQVEGLMYFKDPSGNLIEMYCPKFAGAKELTVAGTPLDVVDLESLNYQWPP